MGKRWGGKVVDDHNLMIDDLSTVIVLFLLDMSKTINNYILFQDNGIFLDAYIINVAKQTSAVIIFSNEEVSSVLLI